MICQSGMRRVPKRLTAANTIPSREFSSLNTKDALNSHFVAHQSICRQEICCISIGCIGIAGENGAPRSMSVLLGCTITN